MVTTRSQSAQNQAYLIVPIKVEDQEEDQYDYSDESEYSSSEYETDEEEITYKRPNSTSRKAEDKNKKLKMYYQGEDIEYYNKLSAKNRKTVDAVEQKIADVNKDDIPLRFRVLESDMDIGLKSITINKLNQLCMMEPGNEEYHKLRNWVENVCKLPIGKYKSLPVTANDDVSKISAFLDNIKQHLDTAVYGHTSVKDNIVRLLAKWIANNDSKGLVIGLEGHPGCGKTSIAMEICHALGLPFGFISLAGISYSEILKGFQYTYQGSTWGSLADILMKSQCMNPILFFDELDKVSSTRPGEEIVNTLIHLTDHSQNHKFSDRYFADIDLDMSKCLMIFSYNDESLINPILKDRMVKIKTEGYSVKDKVKIAKDFMLPKLMKEFAFAQTDIIIPDDVVSHIISLIDEEQGVRNLKRALEDILSRVNLDRLLNKNKTFPFVVTEEIVSSYITKPKPPAFLSNMMYM